jgi:hypothetical protein
MKTTLLFTLFMLSPLFTSTGFAQSSSGLPSGFFSGFVSNNPFEEWCQLNRAEIEFVPQKSGNTLLNWTETGFARQGAGFCDNVFDAVLKPTGKTGEWDVDFNWNFDLNFGKAKLVNGVLTITASFSGSRTGYQWFNTKFIISPDQSSINYQRRIDRMGPTLFANGELYAE